MQEYVWLVSLDLCALRYPLPWFQRADVVFEVASCVLSASIVLCAHAKFAKGNFDFCGRSVVGLQPFRPCNFEIEPGCRRVLPICSHSLLTVYTLAM